MQKKGPTQLHDLSFGIGTELTLEFHDPTLRTKAHLLGASLKRSIIISNPMNGDSPILIKEGRRVSVRFLNSQVMVGFVVGVLATRLHPYPYIHLEYPDEISLVQVRNARRAEVKIVCSLGLESGPDKAGRIIDLSRTGCQLVTAWSEGLPDMPVRLGFKVHLHRVEQIVTVEATIRSKSSQLDENGLTPYGLQFGELDERQHALINAFVNQTILEG